MGGEKALFGGFVWFPVAAVLGFLGVGDKLNALRSLSFMKLHSFQFFNHSHDDTLNPFCV